MNSRNARSVPSSFATTRSSFITATVATFATLGSIGTAVAQGNAYSLSNSDWSGSVTVASDYRFRGLSRSFRDPVVQGGIELKLPSNFYAGVWGSLIDKQFFPNASGFETDVHAGYRTVIGDGVTIDVGLIQYMFPFESEYATLEGYVGAQWRWFGVRLNHTLSNKYFRNEDARGSNYLDLSVSYPFTPKLNLLAHYGIMKVANNDADYVDYKVGVTYDWQGFTWGASVIGTDIDVFATNVAGRTIKLGGRGLVVSLSRRF